MEQQPNRVQKKVKDGVICSRHFPPLTAFLHHTHHPALRLPSAAQV
jgi:hypothetical protein